jgi:hypothetical protein
VCLCSTEVASAADYVNQFGFLPVGCSLSFRSATVPNELANEEMAAIIDSSLKVPKKKPITENPDTMSYSWKKKSQQVIRPQNNSGRQPRDLHAGRCMLRQGFHRYGAPFV